MDNKICRCGTAMMHCSVATFKFSWWKCFDCGNIESNQEITKEIQDFHKLSFPHLYGRLED